MAHDSLAIRTEVEGESAKQRTDRILGQPNAFEDIIDFVTNGGCIPTLSEAWQVRHSDIMRFVHAQENGTKRYHEALRNRAEWGEERILSELRRLGLADIRQLWDERGYLKDPKDWPAEITSAVAGIKVKELFDNDGNKIGEMKEVKFWDKTRAIELLGKNYKLWTEKVEHNVSLTLEQLLAGSHAKETK